MKHIIRTFLVNPAAPAGPPERIEDRVVESPTLSEARAAAFELFRAERRTVRAASYHVDGGLVVYVSPVIPETPPKQRSRRRRARKERA